MSAGAAILPIAGGLAGRFLSGDDGQGLREYALQLIQQVKDPSFDLKSLSPEDRKLIGQYAPEMAQALELGEARQIQDDPRNKEVQRAVLRKMMGEASNGFGIEDRAALNEVQNRQATQNRGQQEAIIQNMQARGMGGGGQELAARMIAQQAEADRASDGGLQVAAQARQRALQAAMNSGTLSGQMRSQDFNVNNSNRNAINDFNMANWKNRQDVTNTNVNARNSAQKYNLGQQQDISNHNVDTRNNFAKYNKEQYNQNQLATSNFQLKRAGMAAGQMNDLASGQDDRKAANAAMWNGLGQAGGAYLAKQPTTMSSPQDPDYEDDLRNGHGG